jgi:hypothetical protein
MSEIRTKIKILIVLPILLLLLTTYNNYEEELILNQLEGEHNPERFEADKRDQEVVHAQEDILEEECKERNVRLGSKGNWLENIFSPRSSDYFLL